MSAVDDATLLAAIRGAMVPRCCHTSGTHDPTHFDEGRYVCESQKARAFDVVRELLGMGKATPAEALPTPGCYWCDRAASIQLPRST